MGAVVTYPSCGIVPNKGTVKKLQLICNIFVVSDSHVFLDFYYTYVKIFEKST